MLALFPFGKMESVYLRTSIGRWDADHKAEIVAVREGRTETSVYLRHALEGEPLQYRLLTDGFAMSATGTMAVVGSYDNLPVFAGKIGTADESIHYLTDIKVLLYHLGLAL